MDILSFLQHLKLKQDSPNTIRSRYLSLRALFTGAYQWNLIPDNPLVKLKAPKVPKTPKGFLSAEEVKALLALCPPRYLLGGSPSVYALAFCYYRDASPRVDLSSDGRPGLAQECGCVQEWKL